MRHLIEQHFERVGQRRSLLLTVMGIVWASIASAIVVWAVGKILWESIWITWDARSGDPVDIAVAVALWGFIALTVPLARAAFEIYRARADEQWAAKVALDKIEVRLADETPNTAYLDSVHERLAMRGLQSLEARIRGSVNDADAAIEQRLIDLVRD